MNKWQKTSLVFVILLVLIGLLGPAGMSAKATVINAHPALLELAAENPDQSVRVIVQARVDYNQARNLAQALGGKITKDLPIINAFAAEMTAQAAIELSASSSVRWVSPDASMLKSTTTTQTLQDQFRTISYSGSSGTVAWTEPWVEIGESDGPSNGLVRVVSAFRCASGSCLRVGGMGASIIDRGLSRSANLSGAASATLTFSYRRIKLMNNDSSVGLQITSDGGANWSTLATYSLTGSDSSQIVQSFDITPFVSSTTQIRFQGFGNLAEGFIFFDNIQIAYEYPAVSNYFLSTTGADQLHTRGMNGQGITIAVVDSGIGAHPDLGSRVLQTPFGFGDPYGHGTHVSGIIAGDATASSGVYKGLAPAANLINLDVTDNTGMAYESNVVAALQWIYENKATYNIRVANLSLNSSVEDSYHNSPLDAAAEILWFNGVVVVASVGNKGPMGGNNTTKTAPANDPFIITVGASNEHGSSSVTDDTIASYSSFGITSDGFSKPDIVAPGSNIVSALSPDSPWNVEHPDRVVDGQYIRLSGTSMAAPMVTGALALLIQDEPTLTPDQLKYRLLATANTIQGDSVSYPYLNILEAVNGATTESANTGLTASQLLWTGSDPITWGSVAWNSVAWNSVAWNSVAWNSVAWNSVYLDGIFWGKEKDKKDK